MMRTIRASLMAGVLLANATVTPAQVILNEANAVGNTEPWVEIDPSKPYEGFDYGILPFSGNTNSPVDPNNPGNPFSDVDALTPGVQSELPNGWTGDTGWARIQENGGDWIELVITDDFADLRGYWLYWENDDNGNGTIGEAGEFGFVRLSFDPRWSNLRRGTIITISEDPLRDEIRDRYPFFLDPPSAAVTHDTGFDYDLSTNISFDPIGIGTQTSPESDGDWHMHFWVNESVTQNGNMDTQYFLAGSNIKADNDDWRHYIFDATNPGPSPTGDRTTGLVQGPIGEADPNWGDLSGGGGVNNQEVISLSHDPNAGIGNAWYEDVDFSTFGRPNLFNVGGIESTLTGVQDFSTKRAWLASTKTGDTNYDDNVDATDLENHVANLTGPQQATDVPWSRGSFDGDGDGDLDDYRQMQLNFGA